MVVRARRLFPVASLGSTYLPIDVLAVRSERQLEHRTADNPIGFGPGLGAPPTYRFDNASRSFGVCSMSLYVASGFARA